MSEKVKIGLEIHQQLNSKNKLFCSCPNTLENEIPLFRFHRYLFPVMGELGKKDRAAEYEFSRKSKFNYNVYSNNCLIEMDEEPPQEINEEAVKIAVQASSFLNCELPYELQIMRKNIIDGSNTSGFQRTILVGLDGHLETSDGKVRIENVSLEEDSCGLHEKNEKETVFDLNRLGVPLIEIGTGPDIKNGEHCKEVALEIGNLLRSLNVKRGLGTIRQDVNISTEKGARVEIKGFQDVKNIDLLVNYEIERQKSLVKIMNDIKRKIKKIEIKKEIVSDVFLKSENKMMNLFSKSGKIIAFKVKGLNGFLRRVVSGQKTLGRELSDYLKVFGIGGYIHSDEDLSKYNISKELEIVKKRLNLEEEDILMLIALNKEQSEQRLEVFLERIGNLANEVPEETRKAEVDWTSSYLRPLAGSSRLYPETDVPPFPIEDIFLEEIKRNLPETLNSRRNRLEKEIGKELANQIFDSPYFELYEHLKNFDNKVVANLLTNTFSKLKGMGLNVDKVSEEKLMEILEFHKSQKITKSAVEEVLKGVIVGNKVKDFIEKNNLWKMNDEEIKEELEKIKKGLGRIKDKNKLKGILTGKFIEKFKGRADGKDLKKMIDNVVKN